MVLHLRPSRDQVSGDLLRNAERFIGLVVKGRIVDEITLPRRRANESQLSHYDFFPTSRVVSVLWGPGGLAGEQVELGSCLRHERRV